MRAHFVDTVQAVSPAGSLVLLSGATVTVVTQGTSTPVGATLYAHDDSVDNATKANPFTTGSDGTVDFYLTTAARVDLLLAKTGYTTVRRTVDVVAPGASGSSAPVYTHTCDGSEAHLVLPDPADSASHRVVLVHLGDPSPDQIELALGANDGNQPVTNNFGTPDVVQFEVPFFAADPPLGFWRAKTVSAGGSLSWAPSALVWELWCFSGTAPGFVAVPFPTGTLVHVFES